VGRIAVSPAVQIGRVGRPSGSLSRTPLNGYIVSRTNDDGRVWVPLLMTLVSRLKNALGRALGFEARRERSERALLLRLCFGDQEAVDRIIVGECSRIAGLSEGEACRRAIRRLQRENR
jgi:hypothetical protein